MNLFMRSVGFKGYSAHDEDALIRRAISAGIKSGKILKNNKHEKAMIVYGISPSAGVGIYGHMSGDRFVYDTHFPYLFTNRSVKEKEITVFKSLTNENFCGVAEQAGGDIPRVFFVSNPIDMLFEIDSRGTGADYDYKTEGDSALKQIVLNDISVSYSGLAIAASVLLAAYDKKQFFGNDGGKETAGAVAGLEKDAPPEAVKDKKTIRFDTEAGKREFSLRSNLKRAETEDILSIVDTHIYPGGQVGEGYVVLANITGIREEENMITGQRFYIMTLQMNNETIEAAVNTADVIGEPKVGRRFNARMWLQGYVM